MVYVESDRQEGVRLKAVVRPQGGGLCGRVCVEIRRPHRP